MATDVLKPVCRTDEECAAVLGALGVELRAIGCHAFMRDGELQLPHGGSVRLKPGQKHANVSLREYLGHGGEGCYVDRSFCFPAKPTAKRWPAIAKKVMAAHAFCDKAYTARARKLDLLYDDVKRMVPEGYDLYRDVHGLELRAVRGPVQWTFEYGEKGTIKARIYMHPDIRISRADRAKRVRMSRLLEAFGSIA